MGNSVPSVINAGGKELKIRRVLKESSDGHVYKSEDSNGKEFALKLKRIARDKNGSITDDDAAEKIAKEQQILKKLKSHPNIIALLDFGVTWEDTAVIYHIITEYCPMNLSTLYDCPNFGESEIMFVLRDVSLGLAHLHNQKPPIAHRNVTLTNILLGADNRFKLCKFGFCSDRHRTFTSGDRSIAKNEIQKHTDPYYRSPEQVDITSGKIVSEMVDIWAVGILLHKLSFKKTPFENSTGEIDQFAIERGFRAEQMPLSPSISPGILVLIKACLNSLPNMRPPASSLLRQCKILNEKGQLPFWPDGNAPYQPDNLVRISSFATSKSEGFVRSNHFQNFSQRSKSFTSENKKGVDLDDLSSSDQSRISRRATISSIFSQNSAKSNKKRSSLSKKMMYGIILDGVASMTYRLVGGNDNLKKLWVLKTTSRQACGPKPKYVRKIVLGLWEGQFAIGTYFELLRFRPIAEAPIVAAKALITLLRALQLGPSNSILECFGYVEMIEEIGDLWKIDEADPRNCSASNMPDYDFTKVIASFSSSIFYKVKFHQRFPGFFCLFNILTRDEKSQSPPAQEIFEIEEAKALALVQSLLHIQAIILDVFKQCFIVLKFGRPDSQVVVRSMVKPLIDEAYSHFVATRRLVNGMNDSLRNGKSNYSPVNDINITFDEIKAKLQSFFDQADMIDEVRLIRSMPKLSLKEDPQECGLLVKITFQSDDKNLANGNYGSSPVSTASFQWPTSQVEAYRTLRKEENILSQLSNNNKTDMKESGSSSDGDSDINACEIEGEKGDSLFIKAQGDCSDSDYQSGSSSNKNTPEKRLRGSFTKVYSDPTDEMKDQDMYINGRNHKQNAANTPPLAPKKRAGEGGYSPSLPPRFVPKQKKQAPAFERDVSTGNIVIKVAKALYNFDDPTPGKLSFRVGDTIKLINEEINDKGWGLGELNGKKGWFPGNFVKIEEMTREEYEILRRPYGRPRINNLRGNANKLSSRKIPAEHKFLIDMLQAQTWKNRLNPGGRMAFRELVGYFNTSGLAMDFKELQVMDVIGSGAFATVFHATLNGKEVAVKKLMGEGGAAMEKNLRDFKTETMLLSRLKHRNIVGLIGATVDPVTIVMEYCSKGNLMLLLTDMSVDISWPKKRQIVIDLANGMKYLHEQRPMIIHRDLKSLNVLVDETWVCKVTDFGLSRFKANTASEKMTGSTGTYHWMAPEVINGMHYNEKADVFSFAIILWEVYTRNIPYNGMAPVQVVALVVNRKERPRIPPSCPQIMAQLMEQCWRHDFKQRPSFAEIVERLKLLPS